MKKTSSFLILLFVSSAISGQFLKKESLRDRMKNSSPLKITEEMGFSSDKTIPPSFSLEKYAVVANQGNSMSCTGFALSGAMNIMYNYLSKTTNYEEMELNRFDPFYFYCSLKDVDDFECITDNACGCGSVIWQGLDIVTSYGGKKWYLEPDFTCSSVLSKPILRALSPITQMYQAEGYSDLFAPYEEIDGKWYPVQGFDKTIKKIKKTLSAGLPIISAVYVGENYQALADKGSEAVFYGDKEWLGGHAITLVGYDDNYKGGAFRVLNSYGSEWGDNGFFWLPYSVFKTHSDEAWVIWIGKENFDSWFSQTHDTDNFYRGKLENGWSWEGPMNEEGYPHGVGILTTEVLCAWASYVNGVAHGSWAVLAFDEDAFSGKLYFENGEIIGEEEFGFSSNTNNSRERTGPQTQHMSVDFGEEVGTENDFAPSLLENIGNLRR